MRFIAYMTTMVGWAFLGVMVAIVLIIFTGWLLSSRVALSGLTALTFCLVNVTKIDATFWPAFLVIWLVFYGFLSFLIWCHNAGETVK